MKPIMFCGTGSDVGKSIIATAICRILRQEGLHPAPFKAQNMAPYYSLTSDGLQIARAQGVQAEAAGVELSTDMNPLMLKPQGNYTSEVILNGVSRGMMSAMQLYEKEERAMLRKEIHSAFDRLSSQYDPIVMEGAGSISEINLRDYDLVNMPMAQYAGANIILVADIDRGGVFASCYGSIALQKPEDRPLIKGIIINKFRGDIRLFQEGRKMMEDICKVPVLGVIPMFEDIAIEEEDTLSDSREVNPHLQDAAFRNLQYEKLAAHVRKYLDMDKLMALLHE